MLAGGGPADVVELTLALAREMLDAAGLSDVDPAAALADGRAMDSWRAMVRAQGGDPDAPLPVAASARRSGPTQTGTWRASTRTRSGVAAWRLGAGRARKEDSVSAAAGVVLHRRPGDRCARATCSTSCGPTTPSGSRPAWRRPAPPCGSRTLTAAAPHGSDRSCWTGSPRRAARAARLVA